MKRVIITFLLVVFAFTLNNAQEIDSTNALHVFDKLVDGKWEYDGGYQTYEWGVGNLSIIAKNYSVKDGEETLISEGYYFYHPGEKVIKGYFTAINMPIFFFDYTTKFVDDKIVSNLTAYSNDGKPAKYTEILHLKDKNYITWDLLVDTKDGKQKIMSGEYRRK